MRYQVCFFCGRPILPFDEVVQLKLGNVHEKCYFKGCLKHYREIFQKIASFPLLEQKFRNKFKNFVRTLEQLKTADEIENFYNTYSEVNNAMLDLLLVWFYARFLKAQRNPLKRFFANHTPKRIHRLGKTNM